MKKIITIISLLTINTLLATDCKKMEINEMQYMTKKELLDNYKENYRLHKIHQNSATRYLNLLKETMDSSVSNMTKMEIEKARCYFTNSENIGRVLKKDFKVTDKELNNLK